MNLAFSRTTVSLISQAYAFHVLSVRISKIQSGRNSREQAIGLLRASLQASRLSCRAMQFVLRERHLLQSLLSGIGVSWLLIIRSIRATCRGIMAVLITAPFPFPTRSERDCARIVDFPSEDFSFYSRVMPRSGCWT